MWGRSHFHFLGHALEAVPVEDRRLGLLIVLVLVLHVLGFIALRVGYPDPAPILTPARQRLMVYAPEGGARMPTVADIGFWSRIDDPSLVVFPPDVLSLPEEARGGEARYHPTGDGADNAAASASASAAPAQALVALDPDVRTLPDRLAPLSQRAADALAEGGPRQVFQYARAPFVPAASGTVAKWSGGPGFSSRAPAEWRLPAAPSDLLPEAGTTVLRLGVDPSGRVAHVLVEESCGNSETDLAAVASARKLRFAAAPEGGSGIVWGNAVVYWRFMPKDGGASSSPATGSAP
ncbi:MAG TPA: energy transducer TonB [Candidatus Methylacidiphilales bacterium]